MRMTSRPGYVLCALLVTATAHAAGQHPTALKSKAAREVFRRATRVLDGMSRHPLISAPMATNVDVARGVLHEILDKASHSRVLNSGNTVNFYRGGELSGALHLEQDGGVTRVRIHDYAKSGPPNRTPIEIQEVSFGQRSGLELMARQLRRTLRRRQSIPAAIRNVVSQWREVGGLRGLWEATSTEHHPVAGELAGYRHTRREVWSRAERGVPLNPAGIVVAPDRGGGRAVIGTTDRRQWRSGDWQQAPPQVSHYVVDDAGKTWNVEDAPSSKVVR